MDSLTEATTNDHHTALAQDVIQKIAALTEAAVRLYPIETQHGIMNALQSGAALTVSVQLQNGSATITGDLEGTTLFSVTLNTGGKEHAMPTRH